MLFQHLTAMRLVHGARQELNGRSLTPALSRKERELVVRSLAPSGEEGQGEGEAPKQPRYRDSAIGGRFGARVAHRSHII